MSDEDDVDPLEEENKKEDEKFMENLIHSIEVLKQENPDEFDRESPVPIEPDSPEPTQQQESIDLDALPVTELRNLLAQIDQAIALNQRLQGTLLMKEVKLLSIKRHLTAPKPRKEKQSDDQRKDVGRYYVRFKAPYFKNIHNFAAYVVVPESQLPVTAQRYETPGGQWNKMAVTDLEANVRLLLSSHSLKEMMKTKPKTYEEKKKIIDRYTFLKKHAPISTLVRSDFDQVIDWCHVASRLRKDFSPNECQKAWNIFLMPGINKKKWTATEKENLKKIAMEHNYQDWDTIAWKLGTKRNGYQCFHMYVEKIMKLVEGSWSNAEEDFLTKLVKECTYGEKTLWHKVAYYFETRTAAQVYRKWTLSCVGKEVVAGAFTEEEDKVIMNMLIVHAGRYSLNQVAKKLNRIPSQIRYRFGQLKSSLKHKYGEWSVEEDRELLRLVAAFGKKNWSLIAEHMPERGRVQIRHRFTNIRRKLAANPDLDLESLTRYKRPVHSKRKENNLKFLMDLARIEDPEMMKDEANPVEQILGQDTKRRRRSGPREPSPCRFNNLEDDPPAVPDDDDEILLESLLPLSPEEPNVDPLELEPTDEKESKTITIARTTEDESGSDDDEPKHKSRSADVSRAIVEYYISNSGFCGDVAKPQGVRKPPNAETLNAMLKFEPYKYFDSKNAEWTYDVDRFDPYFNAVLKMIENRDTGDDEEICDDRLLPPCLTNFEGFYNLLVDMGFTDADLEGPDDKFDEEIRKLYCHDSETIAAVKGWNKRLTAMFAWPAALSEISLEPEDGPAPEASSDGPSTSKGRPKSKSS